MVSNCASRLWPRVSAVMPVPSEMKKAVRFICTLGLKLRTILGYHGPAFAGRKWLHCYLFSRARPQSAELPSPWRVCSELFQHFSGEITLNSPDSPQAQVYRAFQ